jgi:hypothetical protein
MWSCCGSGTDLAAEERQRRADFQARLAQAQQE